MNNKALENLKREYENTAESIKYIYDMYEVEPKKVYDKAMSKIKEFQCYIKALNDLDLLQGEDFYYFDKIMKLNNKLYKIYFDWWNSNI